MTARLCAFVIWAAVAASAVFWGLRLWVTAPPAPPGVSAVEATSAARGDLTRLFGAAPVQPVAAVAAPPAESTRYRLSGVMAPRRGSGNGVALVAVDGKPPRAYRVGARVEGEMVLQSVSLRSATFGTATNPASFTLDLPLLPPPATGTLQAVSFVPNVPPPMPVQSQPPADSPSNGVDTEPTALGTLPQQPATLPAQPAYRRNPGSPGSPASQR